MIRVRLAGGFLMIVLLSCAGTGRAPSTSQPPVITRSYASDNGAYGQIWKIYLEAEDPDGDMFRIASELQQEGVRYRQSVDFIPVKKRDQKYLKGYLSLDTYFLREPILGVGPRLVLRVSIVDKAGNESRTAVFNFEYTGRTSESARLPAPFDQGDLPKLGNIMIEGKVPPPPSP